MLEGLVQVMFLPDFLSEITDIVYRSSGIQLGKMRVPLAKVGVIYESPPNVIIDAANVCLKSVNTTILRGGSEAFYANQAIAASVSIGLRALVLSEEAVQVINTTDPNAFR